MTEIADQIIEELYFSSMENDEIEDTGDSNFDFYRKGFQDGAKLLFELILEGKNKGG